MLQFKTKTSAIFTTMIITVATFTGYFLGIKAVSSNYVELRYIVECMSETRNDLRLKCYDDHISKVNNFLNSQ